MDGICRARLLSDLSGQTPCDKEAGSLDGRLCAFHSRQCQAMYRGYKKRNAELDHLSENAPAYLKSTKTSLVVQEFSNIEDRAVLQELYDYIFRKYVLLEKVIKARKLHHSHFYAIDMDYGHEKYLTKLQSEKHVLARALERLAKRGADVVYKEKEWLAWVKSCQDEEEQQREKESKKVQLEALLFQRHRRELQRQQRDMQKKEQEKREQSFLEEAHKLRLTEMSEEEQDKWDPVQDIYGYERENYVDLINYFLMLQDQGTTSEDLEKKDIGQSSPVPGKEIEKPFSKSAKKRAKKANAETKKRDGFSDPSAEGRGPGTIVMETKSQMRERLSKPVRFERSSGYYFKSGPGPLGLDAETRPVPEDEMDLLLEEVAKVKSLLFCRLLLSHAALLPIALESNSIEEFLADKNVTLEHLRDLCLKLERPELQDVRDACADLVRGEDDDLQHETGLIKDSDEEDDDIPEDKKVPDRYTLKLGHRMPEKYYTKREKAAQKAKKAKKVANRVPDDDDMRNAMVDFGDIVDETDYRRKRTRIKLCGRYMYNYPSEKALSRGGWYHFSVIAKDSSLFDAIELCRNWNEFFEVNVLAIHLFFPAPKWTKFAGDTMRQQLLQLGFIPYFKSDEAEKVTRCFQTGSRGMGRRAHQVVEMRNFLCGNIKRDDPISRRFIQYLSMETWELRALVRDRKTGRVLITPPEEELWILREKVGWGRASKNQFETIIEIGPKFFERMDAARQWRFGFEEYYDVYIWSSTPGLPFPGLQRKVEEVLARAVRVKNVADMFGICAPIFKTVTIDVATYRVRVIKPNEEVETMWDIMQRTAKAWRFPADSDRDPDKDEIIEGMNPAFIYTEADELEDEILFEQSGYNEPSGNLFRANPSLLEKWERAPRIDMRRFVRDLDTDEELSEDESWFSDNMEDEEELEDDLGLIDGEELEGDDGDSTWKSETDFSDSQSIHGNPEVAEIAIQALEKHFQSTTLTENQDPEYFLKVLKNPSAAYWIPQSIRSHGADLMASCRFAMRRIQVLGRGQEEIHDDFQRYIEREKAKVFKDAWHMGDLSQHSLLHSFEWFSLSKSMDDFVMRDINPGPFELCKFMDMAPLFRRDRRIVDDAFAAYAAIALFFDTIEYSEWKGASMFRKSKLLDQAARAKEVPDRRTFRSNKTIPKEFWKPWDRIRKDNNRHPGDQVYDIYPLEWRKAMRPVIIKLFKAGIICNSYRDGASGLAIAAAEPNRPMDLYVDYRHGIPDNTVVSHLEDPTPFDRSYLIKTVRSFKVQYPGACFSVLRLWSAPHFYPLMLGYNNRSEMSFLDDRSRLWDFKFVPKDMPYSEWSVHEQLSLRIRPYRDKLPTNKVIVARDLLLVMGETRSECRRLSEGATWAVQTRPWRLEIDFWRSFVGVDAEFLADLDERWLE